MSVSDLREGTLFTAVSYKGKLRMERCMVVRDRDLVNGRMLTVQLVGRKDDNGKDCFRNFYAGQLEIAK